MSRIGNRCHAWAFVFVIGMMVLTGCQKSIALRPLSVADLERVAAPTTQDPKAAVLWYDAQRLTIEGKGWADTEKPYDRLPAKAKGVVRAPVWNLSKHSAGLCVRFVTDSEKISVRWTVTGENLAMNHMAATGVSGVDLYVKDGATWRWLGVGRPTKPTNESVLADGIPVGTYEYAMYLPLYNGTKSLEIGLNPKAAMYKPSPRPASHAKSICFYGTSITQGGCATRAGMAYPAILGRMLERPTINLGFSGNGQMEPEMASLLAELDVAVYVLDALPNMQKQMVAERVVPFVEILRKAHPDTPIVLVENLPYQYTLFLPKPRQEQKDKNQTLRAAYEQLVKKGVRNLTYVPGSDLVGHDGEATVDGAHLTDLGFLRFANTIKPELCKLQGG